MGPAPSGLPRTRIRVPLHGHLDPDPDPAVAGDQQLDRLAQGSALAVPPRHRRARAPPLRRQLHAPLRHRADRRPHRGADAADALPRVPALPARVLRPPCDGPGALARDERPLPDPLLHRLGARAGHAERDDDHRHGHRARGRQSEARPLHRRGDAADHGARAAVRAPRLADLPPGAGAEGRRDGGCGRGRGRDRDGAGVRPRGRRPRAVRRPSRGGARHRAAAGRRRGAAPAGAVLPPVALDCSGRLLRRHTGDQRRPRHRPVRPVRDAAAPARLAARGARLDHEPRAARARVGRPQLRLARGNPAAAGARRAEAAADGRARRALRGGAVRLRRRKSTCCTTSTCR